MLNRQIVFVPLRWICPLWMHAFMCAARPNTDVMCMNFPKTMLTHLNEKKKYLIHISATAKPTRTSILAPPVSLFVRWQIEISMGAEPGTRQGNQINVWMLFVFKLKASGLTGALPWAKFLAGNLQPSRWMVFEGSANVFQPPNCSVWPRSHPPTYSGKKNEDNEMLWVPQIHLI